MKPSHRLRLLVRSAAWAAVLPVLKRMLSTPRLAALMWREPRVSSRDAVLEHQVVTFVRRLYASGRIPRRHNCLERSLLTYRYLSELNAAPRLVIGLPDGGSRAQGHAWVAVDGLPVGETDDTLEELVPVVTFGRGGAIVADADAIA